jgi:hypothetical protein
VPYRLDYLNVKRRTHITTSHQYTQWNPEGIFMVLRRKVDSKMEEIQLKRVDKDEVD